MNTPPLLMFAALAFWGWRTDLMVPAVISGLLLECSRVVPTRWEFAPKELRRIWDLCVLLLAGAVVYILFSDHLLNPALAIFQWLPLLALPMMLAQAFGHLERMPGSTFSLILRAARSETADTWALNVSYPYLGVCLLSASATDDRGPQFYVVLCGLVAWALWPGRSRRFSDLAWAALLASVVVLAHAGAAGLHELHTRLEGRFSEWLAGLIQPEFDASESRTAIGQIGRLKLSGRIVLRVESSGPPPALLRMASYDQYRNSWWYASHKDFAEVSSEASDGSWRLVPHKTTRQTVTVASYLRKGTGLISLPLGTAEIDQLPAQRLETNLLGTVRAIEGPGLVRYLARYGAGISFDGPTNDVDLYLPERPPQPEQRGTRGRPRIENDRELKLWDLSVSESASSKQPVIGSDREAVERIAQDLDLANKPASEVARTLESFFANRFTYATYVSKGNVSEFLLKTRAGHCEYFATATVLLLRQAKIPARYATGYSVQESAGKGKYVVRERHAHAWAIYFDSAAGVWRELDTTPPSWNAVESARPSPWQAINDFFSRIRYEFAKWRWLTDRSTLQRYVLFLLVPLVGILTYRLSTARRRARSLAPTDSSSSIPDWPGLDSEFYLVERRLAALGMGREPGETALNWIRRLESSAPFLNLPARLNELLNLHYRLRFDPVGLSDADRVRLRDGAQQWLREADGALCKR